MAPSDFMGIRYNNDKDFIEMNPPVLSIITPIYCSDYAVEVLKRSLLLSDVPSVQRIIVHDCPESRNCRQLESIERDPGTIELVKSAAANVGIARNLGLKQATGLWVTFWDADDQPNLHATLEIISHATEVNLDIAVCGYTKKDHQLGTQISISPSSRFELLNSLKVANEPAIWRMILKSTIASKGIHLHQNLAEDQYYLASLIRLNPKIGFYAESIYEYQFNLSGQLTSKRINPVDIRRAIHEIRRLPNEGTSALNRLVIRGMCVRLALTLVRHNLKERKLVNKNLLTLISLLNGFGTIGIIYFCLLSLRRKV
jgi:glycosyltransferase involved in cell wall biosynthesis